MNSGIGDFLVVDFAGSAVNWNEMVKSRHANIADYVPLSDNIIEISDSKKALLFGDVSIDEQMSVSTVDISVKIVVGDSSIYDFINNKTNKFYGKFALVRVDKEHDQIKVYTDATRQVALYYYQNNGITAVSTDIRLFNFIVGFDKTVDEQAIYHHLNFSYIPTPYTIYKNVSKIPPGSVLTCSKGKVDITRYWIPEYPEDFNYSESELVKKLNEKIIETLSQYRCDDQSIGCFLSGGTDSSTITGVISRAQGADQTHAYSIGFNEKGYDELEYAAIAANKFGVNHHYKRINLDDTVSAIDTLIKNTDEPFGNSSAIPTYHCAKLAKEDGRKILLGGDGGDEIFGGNERYAKDYYFNLFYTLPTPLKTTLRSMTSLFKPLDLRITNRVRNFVNRASLSNPERFYTDDSFASDFFDELLTTDYRKSISKDSSLSILERHYNDCTSKSELNKLMYIDLQMAISDNDLTKVNRSAAAAGISTLYPYLTPDLIQFMGHVHHTFKVNKTQKRYLFKKAVDNILPDEIKVKKKQGFGLPVGEWFRHDKEFRSYLFDTLMSKKCINRGYFNKEFISNLISMHQRGGWDYTQELWLLLMLELWHQEYIDE